MEAGLIKGSATILLVDDDLLLFDVWSCNDLRPIICPYYRRKGTAK